MLNDCFYSGSAVGFQLLAYGGRNDSIITRAIMESGNRYTKFNSTFLEYILLINRFKKCSI